MSEPQTDADADAEPTFASAPWTARRIKPDEKIPAIGESAVWGSDGDLVAAVSVGMTGDGLESAYDRARLIAAAGTAAHEARDMGYDPVAAVESLPELLNLAAQLRGTLQALDRNFRGTFGGEKQAVENFLDALKSAEGSGE